MRKRIFSGIQPSGGLHIGNYYGAIKNWLKLQDEYECIWGIVNYHAMTVDYDPIEMPKRIINAAVSYIACGLDPDKSMLMVQSDVPEHTELTWILNTVTPVSWLERVPTFKEKSARHTQNINMGLLDYPILMAADVIIYKAFAVPVGEDQVPHIELMREIARKFNTKYGKTFPEPKELLPESGARILGIDGKNKMSKSLENCIYLDETPENIWKKLSTAMTDPQRIRRKDAGNPDVCNLYSFHKIFSSDEELKWVNEGCRSAGIGCIDCKKVLAKNIAEDIAPIREKQEELYKDLDYVKDILREGAKKARKIAQETMAEVYEKIGFIF